MTILTCPACGKEFKKRAPHHMYCAVACYKRIYMRWYKVHGKGKYNARCTR